MKRWKNSLIIIGMMALLLIAYIIPVVVTKAEDRSLGRKTKTCEIEGIRITSDNSSFVEELQEFPIVLLDDIVIQQEQNEHDESEGIAQSEEFIRRQVKEFVGLITNQENVEISELSYNKSIRASIHTGNVYEIWNCSFVDEEGEASYMFFLDDTTGKVLAFQMWRENWQENAETFINCFQQLGNYYGFDDCEIVELDFTSKESESVVIFRNADADGPELMLPIYKYGDTISFNLGLGKKNIYYDE